MAEQVAEKIRSELCRPYQLGDTVYNSSSSIGIVILRGHEESEENLLSHVDAAMYQAKGQGRDRVQFYEAQTGVTSSRSLRDSPSFIARPTQNRAIVSAVVCP